MDLEKISEQINYEEMEKEKNYITVWGVASAVFISVASNFLGNDSETVNILGSVSLCGGIYNGLISINYIMKTSNPLNYIKRKETKN